MGIREQYPNFIVDALQIHYYQACYDDIVGNQVAIKGQDVYALGMLALNLALIEKCSLLITESDEDPDRKTNGMIIAMQGDRKLCDRVNPALGVIEKAGAQVKFYFERFQMTPQSRIVKGSNGLNESPGTGSNDPSMSEEDFKSI